ARADAPTPSAAALAGARHLVHANRAQRRRRGLPRQSRAAHTGTAGRAARRAERLVRRGRAGVQGLPVAGPWRQRLCRRGPRAGATPMRRGPAAVALLAALLPATPAVAM